LRGKIGVWGHFHGGNIGDDIVVATLIENLRQRLPGHEIHGFSLNPADTASRHRVPSSAIRGGPIYPAGSTADPESGRRDTGRPPQPAATSSDASGPRAGMMASARSIVRSVLPESVKPALRSARRLLRDLFGVPPMWRRLRGFDAIFVAGSGPVFDDMGGPWVHPYNLLRWALVCRLAGTKFCLMNVGAGPIHRPLSRRFLAWALKLSHYHAFRDQSSADLARMLGTRKPTPCLCDMAFAVPGSELELARGNAIHGARPLVGIAPMAYMDKLYWPNADASVGERYLDALAELSLWLLDTGYDLVILKSQRHADERTATRLLDSMRALSPGLDETRIHNPDTPGHRALLSYLAGCTIVVGGRFHCHVLPFVLGIPVLGVSYHPKTDELMRQMKQDAYFAPMDDVTGAELIRMFQRLAGARPAVLAEIKRHTEDNRRMLDRQFDDVFSADFLAG
jgi:polysaccharide pyruvyl transferase WcaK-like protein